jgi:phenylalanyl-tRNA synthetase alpha chain
VLALAGNRVVPRCDYFASSRLSAGLILFSAPKIDFVNPNKEFIIMKETLLKMKEEALAALAAPDADLEALRIRYLGKKGELTAVLRGMGKLSAEERPVIGQIANEVREAIENELTARAQEQKTAALAARLSAEKLDVTVPGTVPEIGHIHPLDRVQRDMEEIFIGMGFDIVEGPEVEYDYYNFQALNIPPDHPARDTQDTFYITDNILLRSQTSPVQARTMEKRKPPIRIISPGRVYRSDAMDATHSPLFHQMEGLVVDKNVTMGDLKGTLEMFAKKMFGEETKVRFRPHHFPFTEPSAEVDVSCFACGGKGCRLCKGEGWIEILGAGMVHPNVLRMCNIDPDEYSGFAFGMGVERVTMLKYHIDDIRHLYENDVRFLSQF